MVHKLQHIGTHGYLAVSATIDEEALNGRHGGGGVRFKLAVMPWP